MKDGRRDFQIILIVLFAQLAFVTHKVYHTILIHVKPYDCIRLVLLHQYTDNNNFSILTMLSDGICLVLLTVAVLLGAVEKIEESIS